MQRGLVMVSCPLTTFTYHSHVQSRQSTLRPRTRSVATHLLHALVGNPRMTGITMDDSLAGSRAASDDAKRGGGPSLHASNYAFPTPTLRSPNRTHQPSIEPTDLSDSTTCGKHCPMSVPPRTQRSPAGVHPCPCSCPRPTSDSHSLSSPAASALCPCLLPKKQASPQPIPRLLVHWLTTRQQAMHKRRAWHCPRELPPLLPSQTRHVLSDASLSTIPD